MRLLFAILFFSLLGALIFLTYYPDMPDMKVRIRNEWFRLDYFGHMGFYAALTASFLIWRTGWRGKVNPLFLLWTIFGGVVLGVVTELTQSFIPGRSSNPVDLIYNIAGILTGAAAVYLISRSTLNTKH